MLATSREHRRPRTWLQDKLWSERGPEQGAASLRQVLTSIRQALGKDRSCVLTERGWVALDPALVVVEPEPSPGDPGAGQVPEFCEGLDIRDPEFEDWIRDQRAAWEQRLEAALPSPRPRPRPMPGAEATRAVLLLAPSRGNDDGALAAADLLSTHIAAQVSRSGGIEVRLENADASVHADADAIRLELNACRFGERSVVQARLVDPVRSALLWTASRDVPLSAGAGGDADFPAFVAEVATAATRELGRGGSGEAGSLTRKYYRALRDVFSYDGATLSTCDQALAAAPEMPGAAARRAWRAYIRVVSLIERLAHDPASTRGEAMELASMAVAEDPANPIVNALASDVALHIEVRALKAYELARTSVEQDGYSPFTHASLAQALAGVGEVERAHGEAERALRLSVGQPNPSWWHMRCCITAIRSGRLDDAARYAQAARELAPTFKPPLRCLAALRYHQGDEQAATQALQELKRLEPDFSLELMGSDDYPVASLRAASLLGVVRSGLL